MTFLSLVDLRWTAAFSRPMVGEVEKRVKVASGVIRWTSIWRMATAGSEEPLPVAIARFSPSCCTVSTWIERVR
jgi:hypothetical protein